MQFFRIAVRRISLISHHFSLSMFSKIGKGEKKMSTCDATGVKPASCVRVLREFKHPPRRHPSRSEMPRKLLPILLMNREKSS